MIYDIFISIAISSNVAWVWFFYGHRTRVTQTRQQMQDLITRNQVLYQQMDRYHGGYQENIKRMAIEISNLRKLVEKKEMVDSV